MLLNCKTPGTIEAGCDEAGRGCLAGPVYAAAVILPAGYGSELGIVTAEEIDEINILNASILAMHRAIKALSVQPEYLLIDGNRFKPYGTTPYSCEVKGDARYMSIAAASILAKTYRDDFMKKLALQYPRYGWEINKGYPTQKHRRAIEEYGITPYHRKTFRLTERQLTLF